MQAILAVTDMKVICLYSSIQKDGHYSVDAYIEEGFMPIRRNRPVSGYGIRNAVERAMKKAHDAAGRRVAEVYVGVPGAFCQTLVFNEMQGEPEQGGLYGDQDYELIEKLTLRNRNTAMILGLRSYVAEIGAGLGAVHMRPKALYSQTQALGKYLIPRSARENVAILLDIGYYHSDICVFTGDGQIFSAGLFLGGGHVTSDLAQILEIEMPFAEQLKRQCAFGIRMEEGTMDYVRLPDGKLQPFSHAQVESIITARLEEICDLIRETLRASRIPFTDKTRIYLLGEGVRGIQGVRDFIGTKLGFSVEGLPIEITDGITRMEPVAISLLELLMEKPANKSFRNRLQPFSRFAKHKEA